MSPIKLKVYVTTKAIPGCSDTPEDSPPRWYQDHGGIRYELNYFEPDEADESVLWQEHEFTVTPRMREEFVPAAIKAINNRIGRLELDHYAQVKNLEERIATLSCITYQPEE